MIFRRRGRFLVLLVCAWFYGTLLFLYPKSFRLRYSAELRRDFFGLSREALREGGILGVVRVWAHAFSALALTGIRQRRNTLPMEQRVASAMVMMVQVAVVAVIVAMVSIWMAPPHKAPDPVATDKQTREPLMKKARGYIWLTERPDTKRVRVAKPGGASYSINPPGRPEKIEAVKNATHTPSVAKEVIRRLDLQMKPAELLDNLAIETKEYVDEPIPKDFASHGCCYLKSTLVTRTYKDTDLKRARRILDMVGKVAFENSDSIGYEKARIRQPPPIPVTPESPQPPNNALRSGLLTLAYGWALCLILKRREFKYALSNRGAIKDAGYYLWETKYAYYLSLSQTASAKVTTAVGFLITLVLSIASMVGGGGSKPAPFD
jgi:hypothetical protein